MITRNDIGIHAVIVHENRESLAADGKESRVAEHLANLTVEFIVRLI